MKGQSIAYFSAEFALHQSLPIYAGGLGVLAGDHCKEASDLGVPLIGVGFMYPQGYFHQHITADGWQEEGYEKLNWADTADRAGADANRRAGDYGRALSATARCSWPCGACAWAGSPSTCSTPTSKRTPRGTGPSRRASTAAIAKRACSRRSSSASAASARFAHLGCNPTVWHLNEGHAGFVVLQRIREFVDQGLSFDAALDEVRRTTVFTTHTPVPAGHDAFNFQLVEKHLAGAWGSLGTYRPQFLALGEYDNGNGPQFNMTALALRASASVNAVSQLHGEVTREMWVPIWPDTRVEDAPVKALTNGVHVPTWVSNEMAQLFARHLGEDWIERHDDPALWDRILDVPDAELWAVRSSLRQYLFSFIRQRARSLWTNERVSAARVLAAGTLLDSDALTIGFARRFTGYKRPDLVFRDPERLARILNTAGRPLQFVFAGKSHPADDTGKHRLQGVYRHALDPAFAGRVAFVEDYDLHVAHFLVQGCDVWLNNPRKPLEASGTSGMKASINGVPHFSIGDGWWAEAYNGRNGWLIDGGGGGDEAAVDDADADSLYRLLEEEIVPAFYDRGPDQVPHRWLQVVKEAIRTVTPQFSTRRMVKEYVQRMYLPAARQGALR